MNMRKALVSKNSKEADKKVLDRFGTYLRDPYTDENCEFKLDPIDPDGTIVGALQEFYKLKKQFCGLYLIGFARVLRHVNRGTDGNPRYQDLIVRTVNADTAVPAEEQLNMYTWSGFRTKFSTLLNALRRHHLSLAQKKIIECKKTNRNIPEWAEFPKNYDVWKNGEYGEVEANYRIIADWLFIHKNPDGTKAVKYLPSGSFMSGFRRLEETYLKKDKSPRDIIIYIIIRFIAIYPGRSGAEMRQWSRMNILIREVWMKLSIPKGWKNTKAGNKLKTYIKISSDDPLYAVVVEYLSLCPKSVESESRNIYENVPFFLRPKKKYIVKKNRVILRLLFAKLSTTFLLYSG